MLVCCAKNLYAVLAAGLLAACAVNPLTAPDIPPTRDFSALTCDDLAAERLRIEQGFRDLRFEHEHGTREKIGRLKGEAAAANDQIRMKSCQVPNVRTPGKSWAFEEKYH